MFAWQLMQLNSWWNLVERFFFLFMYFVTWENKRHKIILNTPHIADKIKYKLSINNKSAQFIKYLKNKCYIWNIKTWLAQNARIVKYTYFRNFIHTWFAPFDRDYHKTLTNRPDLLETMPHNLLCALLQYTSLPPLFGIVRSWIWNGLDIYVVRIDVWSTHILFATAAHFDANRVPIYRSSYAAQHARKVHTFSALAVWTENRARCALLQRCDGLMGGGVFGYSERIVWRSV